MYWQRFSIGAQGWLGRSIGVAILCAILVVSCQASGPRSGQSTGQSTGQVGQSGQSDRLTLGTTAKVRTLDPADSYELMSGNLLLNLGDRLYALEADPALAGATKLVPQLATALPTISADGLRYQIPLRSGVTFHDGQPFNAAAMKFSLDRFIQNKGNPSSLLDKFVAKIETNGANELTIVLKSPFAGFPTVLTFPGLCAVSPKAYEIGERKFHPETFVGTGPYKLTQYGTDNLKLTANPTYWGPKPKNPGIDVQVFADSSSLYSAITTQGVDLGYQSLDPSQIRSLQTSGKVQVFESKGIGLHYLSLNLRSAPLDRPEVRRAFAAMIDRPLLSERVFDNQVQPAYSLIPEALSQSQPVFEQRYGSGDPDQAIALLKLAGYSPQKPLELELWYRANLKSNVLAASLIKAIGDERMNGYVKLKLEGVASATAYSNLDKGAYPIFMLDWSPDYLDPDSYVQPFVDCEKGSIAQGCETGESQFQGSFYYSSKANQLIAAGRKATDPKSRQGIYSQLQDRIAEDVPFIPLWTNKEFLFAQPNVTGAIVLPTAQIPFSNLSKSNSAPAPKPSAALK
jgi:peptide/nickel transport system substrate-binding protein